MPPPGGAAASTAGECFFKVVIVGDSGVGKSCLLMRVADDKFSESYVTTLGVDFRLWTTNIGNTSVKLKIFDTAGQERFRSITRAYYRSADGIIVVYDVTQKESFANVSEWLAEAAKHSRSGVVTILVGNKSDMTEKREVDESEAKAFAEERGLSHIETSAKLSANVESAFISIASELIRHKPEQEAPPATSIQPTTTTSTKGKCC